MAVFVPTAMLYPVVLIEHCLSCQNDETVNYARHGDKYFFTISNLIKNDIGLIEMFGQDFVDTKEKYRLI